MEERKLQKALAILEASNADFVSPDDVAESIASVISVIQEVKKVLEGSMESSTDELKLLIKDTTYSIDDLEAKLKTRINSGEKDINTKIKNISDELRNEIKQVEVKIPTIPEMPKPTDLSGLENRLTKIESKEAPEEVTGEEIVKKINDLEVEPEKQIDAKHIKNLDKYVGKGNTVYLGPGNSGGGRIIRGYDLSASLDGNTRTFSLPAFWRIVSVALSSNPVCRPTTDYTVSGFQITFTSEISLSDLSAGQSCMILYAES